MYIMEYYSATQNKIVSFGTEDLDVSEINQMLKDKYHLSRKTMTKTEWRHRKEKGDQ